ncbi:MAG: hypothetical protein JXR52_03425 [Bacteroidales bacterium]|nr:hypothetical protein [Bacteroidales bacterium]
MKTLFKVLSAVLFVMLLVSCSETDEVQDNRIEQIYENRSNESKPNPSLLEDNLISVERIGKDHRISKEIRDELNRYGIPSASYDLSSVNRFRFNYSRCNLYSLQANSDGERFILYEYDGQYLLMQAKLETVSDTIRLFELHTADGVLCYSMEVSESNLLGTIVIGDNPALNAFRESVSEQIERKRVLKGTKADYCRQEASWSACFECSLEYCASKWYCSAAISIYPMEFLAGFAASCIGASPDAMA